MTTIVGPWVEVAEEFGLYGSDQSSNGKHSFSGKTLLEKKELFRLFDIFARDVGSSSPEVTASLITKYYSRIIGAGGLYAISVRNVGLNLSLEYITLQTSDEWSPIVQYASTPDPFNATSADRRTWREGVLHSIFVNNLQPVFQSLATHTHIDISVLWANAAYSIHYYYEDWIQKAESDRLRAQIQDDFNFVTHQAGAELFGGLGQNPLDIHFKTIDHPLNPNQKLRLRHKCCLRYLLPEGANCTTCPRLNEDAREEILKAYQEKK
jgi:siderophore-iron reductase FhuF